MADTQTSNALILPPSVQMAALVEMERRYSDTIQGYRAAYLAEAVENADLRSRIEEEGWIRLNESESGEFSREKLGRIIARCRYRYLVDPLINRAVEIGALYVWGQDLSHNAADADVAKVLTRFDEDNDGTLTGQQASRLLEVELQVTGNVFLAFFVDAIDGRVRVRHTPVEEVKEIVANPDDRTEVWFYRRTWTQRKADGVGDDQRTAFHPDWRYTPANKPVAMRWQGQDVPILWDVPLAHVSVGSFLHWHWGVPEIFVALDWTKAYKGMLENDATRSESLSMFAWTTEVTGGAQGVAAMKTKLGTTLSTGVAETNPPPVRGSVAILGGGQTMKPVNLSGAMLDPEHSRPVRLMASAALGISDHFFDADVGNFATAKTLDRPTELRWNERRQFWRDLRTKLYWYAIDADLAAPRGILPKALTEDARKIELSWPDLLERSVTERVTAIVDAATLAGREPAVTIPQETTSRLLLSALNVEDIDAELDKLDAERAEREERAAEIAQQTRQGPPGEDQEREAFVAALRELREATRALAR